MPALGELAVYCEGEQLAVMSYANGCYLSRQAFAELPQQAADICLIDLRCLIPLHIDAIIQAQQVASPIVISMGLLQQRSSVV